MASGLMAPAMRNSTATFTMGTTAAAVAFAYAVTSATRAFTMWSKPAVTHANKRHSRRPSGVTN